MASSSLSSGTTVGIMAAVAAPLVMTIGFILWDNHWKGSTFSLNLFKCNLASIGFLIVSLCTSTSRHFASNFTAESVGFLMLSSFIGIIVGDLLWLEGLRLLGARRVILVDSLKPFLAAIMGYLFLGEALHAGAIGGIILTVAGILIVSLEQTGPNNDTPTDEKHDDSLAQEGNETATLTATTVYALDWETDRNATANDPEEGMPKLDASSTSIDEPSTNPSGVKCTHAPLPPGRKEESADNRRVMQDNDNDDDNDNPRVENEEAPTPTDHHDVCHDNATPNRDSYSLRESRTYTKALFQKGYAMAFLNVLFDTYGSVLTKQYGSALSTWEISLIRFGFAGLVLLGVSFAMAIYDKSNGCNASRLSTRWLQNRDGTPQHPARYEQQPQGSCWYWIPTHHKMTYRNWSFIVSGVGLVTFATPALSNYALFEIALALALTLTSIGPLYALPLAWWLQQDTPTVRATLGAMVAVSGVVVLSLFRTQ